MTGTWRKTKCAWVWGFARAGVGIRPRKEERTGHARGEVGDRGRGTRASGMARVGRGEGVAQAMMGGRRWA